MYYPNVLSKGVYNDFCWLLVPISRSNVLLEIDVGKYISWVYKILMTHIPEI